MKYLWSCHRKRLRLRGLASLPSLLTSLRMARSDKYAPSHRAVKRNKDNSDHLLGLWLGSRVDGFR